MARILGSISAEFSTYCPRGLFTGFLAIGGSDKFSPFVDSVRGDQFHTNRIIRSHKFKQLGEEILAKMLGIESLSILLTHFKHLQIGNSKLLLHFHQNLAKTHITIRLDHSIRPIGHRLPNQPLPRKLVPKIHNLQLPSITSQYIPDVQVSEGDLGIGDFLQEYFVIFHVMLWVENGVTI